MRGRSLLNVAVVAFGLFLVGGCGGEDDDQSAPDAGPVNDVAMDIDEGEDDMDAARDTPPENEPDAWQPDGSDLPPDAEESEPDVRGDTSDEEADVGPDPSEVDSDFDGLTNAEEADLCQGRGSDPNDSDTDDDGLSDFKEYRVGTSPCEKDTDGDGANDAKELKWGLNPTARSSFDDEIVDGNRWILEACQGKTPGSVNFHENAAGNWSLALPTAFANYTNLTISNGQAPLAAAVYDDTTNEVAGFTLSQSNPTNATGPEQPLAANPTGSVLGALKSVSTLNQDLVGGEYQTHDGYRAATAEYEVSVGGPSISVRKFRENLLLEIAPFSDGEVTGLPNSSGATYKEFKVVVSVVFRGNTSGPDQRIVTAAIAPFEKTNPQSASYNRYVPIRLDDLTNTTNLAEQVDTSKSECLKFTADAEPPKADFYWVLDHSGSMDQDNETIKGLRDVFTTQIQNTALEYRLGVTWMKPSTDGTLRTPPAWHTSTSKFASEVQHVIDMNGGTEAGLKNALHGIRYMTGGAPTPPTPPEKIEQDTEVITIFVSDEPPETTKNNTYGMVNKNGVSGINSVQDYMNWFSGRTTAFAIVTRDNQCSSLYDDPKAYRDVARATGGKTANLCNVDLEKTITDIILAATSVASNYNPKPTPISSSLKVFMNGNYVPRSREDGYAYYSNQNAVAFFGKYRPEPDKADKPNIAPDRLAIVYEAWRDKCKEDDQGAFNCANQE